MQSSFIEGQVIEGLQYFLATFMTTYVFLYHSEKVPGGENKEGEKEKVCENDCWSDLGGSYPG